MIGKLGFNCLRDTKTKSLVKSHQTRSTLSSLPELIRSYSMQEKYENKNRSLSNLPTDTQNGNNCSLSLELKEIEDNEIEKFHKLIFPKLPPQEHQILNQDRDIQSAKDSSNLIKSKKLNGKTIFSTVTIKFNECSIFAISHWAAKSSFPDNFEDERNRLKREYYPAPDVSLRKCNICNRWGHYDIECDRMTMYEAYYYSKTLTNQSIRLNNIILKGDTQLKVQNSTNGVAEVSYGSESDLGCCVCGEDVNNSTLLQCFKCKHQFHIGRIELSFTLFLKSGFICSVCSEGVGRDLAVESYGTFILEQSKTIIPKDSGLNNYLNNSLPCARTQIVQGHINDSNLSLVESILSPNDLCWAKRGNSLPGSLGKHKWWPGMVIYVFDVAGNNRNQGQDRKSYVVRFFCCQGGGRVRATEVIPFIPNFDMIWDDRLAHPEEPDYEFFIKALKEASNVSNCSFPTDPPKQTAKKRKYKRTMSESSLTSSTAVTSNHSKDSIGGNNDKPISSDWENAEVSEQDGILILAKRDGKQNSSERSSNDEVTDSSTSKNIILKDEESSLNQESIAASVKHFFNQTHEGENTSNPTVDCLSLPKDQLLGGIVSWSKLGIHSGRVSDSFVNGATNYCKIQHGKILALSISNDKALVRTLASNKALNTPAQMQTSTINNSSKDTGNMVWMPLERLSLINTSTNNDRGNESLTKSPPRGVKRAVSISDSLENNWAKYAKADESSKTNSQNGEVKGEPNGRSSSAMSKRLSVADTLQQSLAKLAGGRTSGIYRAERILNARTIKIAGKSSKQYQIKWAGVNEITWEPKDHIFDINLLNEYHERNKSNEMDKNDGRGCDVKSKGKYKNAKNLYCPFCGVRCKDGQSLGGHIRRHRNEPNYKETLNSGKFLTSPPTPKEKNSDDVGIAQRTVTPAFPSTNTKKEFKCYFCGEICKDGPQYAGHVRKHISEPNYQEVLAIAKLDRNKAAKN